MVCYSRNDRKRPRESRDGSDGSVSDNLKTAVVRALVVGLQEACKNSAETKSQILVVADPVMFDQYGKLSPSDQRGRLDVLLYELRGNDYIGEIILQYNEGTTKANLLKRVKFIKDHIFRRRNFSPNRIVVMSEPSGGDATVIYRSPPGARSICPSCKVYP